ncbi:MBL fold metallo-hydrolase [Deltaproteobacteria bacterium TL4]
MQVTLYGVRGSLPSGISGKALEARIEHALQLFFQLGYTRAEEIHPFLENLAFYQKGTYGSNTMCVELRNEKGSIIFDSGSGIREIGSKYYLTQQTFHIFQTHFHTDHTCGLPFFIPIHMSGKELHFYSPHSSFQQGIEDLFKAPYFPVNYADLASKHYFHNVKKYKAIKLFDMVITPFQLDHPNDAYGYHVQEKDKRLVICFDAEFKRMSRQDLGEDLKYYQGADVILFDGQYTMSEVLQKIDWGHCTAQVGVDLCLREAIKHLVVVHHDPQSSDEKLHELEHIVNRYYKRLYKTLKTENPKQIPLEITWGYEGLTLEL